MRDFQKNGRSMVYAENGICAASHPLAAQVAISTLQAGGNAVDAGVAAAMVLNICEPHMTGLGGDCFALLQPAEGAAIIGLNASGRAPASANAAGLRAQNHIRIASDSADAVTMPGAVDGFLRLIEDHGRLGRDRVLAPAIHYAENGVPVAPRVARDLAVFSKDLRLHAQAFFLNNGQPFATGDRFKAPGQAEVLRRIVLQGRAGFYEGEVADDMIASLNALGGGHDLDDLAQVRADYVAPVSTLYRGTELIELPPNGQGATALLLANILSHFDFTGMDPYGAARTHLLAEAGKLAYDARNRFVSDPAHMGARLAHLLAPETAARLAALISPNTVLPLPSPPLEDVHKDTVYLTVVDKDRMALSLIYSIFSGFGSGQASEKFGILFHDRGTGFNLVKGHPNELAPGKRPMHTIIPGMIRDGKNLMPFGVMGGQYQAVGHAHYLSNLVDFSMDMQTAFDAPRAFADHDALWLETGIAPNVAQQLTDLGHRVKWRATALGGAQAIQIDVARGILIGASDFRKDGCALGY
ncbi:MAG: gamma-glutamyltransferase family protein [Paracoccaceae bacterium]